MGCGGVTGGRGGGFRFFGCVGMYFSGFSSSIGYEIIWVFEIGEGADDSFFFVCQEGGATDSESSEKKANNHAGFDVCVVVRMEVD